MVGNPLRQWRWCIPVRRQSWPPPFGRLPQSLRGRGQFCVRERHGQRPAATDAAARPERSRVAPANAGRYRNPLSPDQPGDAAGKHVLGSAHPARWLYPNRARAETVFSIGRWAPPARPAVSRPASCPSTRVLRRCPRTRLQIRNSRCIEQFRGQCTLFVLAFASPPGPLSEKERGEPADSGRYTDLETALMIHRT